MEMRAIMEDKTNITFEAALARLEEIVRALESGTAPLDESLSMFEEGVALVKICTDRLDSAEQKIKTLFKNKDGSYEEQPFEPVE
ncbi:MAG: exodeoxyribonuclease VII small subunit [Eubacteriales bacterium]|jgi:exodeoxyribonuclease VII small subunit